MNIDLKIATEYLKSDAGKMYIALKKIDDENDKKEMFELKNRIEKAIHAFNDFVDLIGKEIGLYCVYHNGLFDGTCRKTKQFMWVELKTEQGLLSPESISVFLEKDKSGEVYVRVATDISEKYANEIDIRRHDDILLKNLPDGFCYALNEKSNRDIDYYNDRTVAEKLFFQGKYLKVQICKVIRADKENIEKDLVFTVKKLLPYYQKLIALY